MKLLCPWAAFREEYPWTQLTEFSSLWLTDGHSRFPDHCSWRLSSCSRSLAFQIQLWAGGFLSWSSGSLIPFCLLSLARLFHLCFFLNSLLHLLICCVDVGKEKHTCCGACGCYGQFSPSHYKDPGSLTQDISLGGMSLYLQTDLTGPFIRFQGLVSWPLVHSGNQEQSPWFIAILLTNTMPSAESLHSNP